MSNHNQAKGTAFETLIATYLNQQIDDRIERRTKSGRNDRGDINAWRCVFGQRIVAELKNEKRFDLSGWVNEAEVERMNDDAQVGLVIAKRRGKGQPGDQYVVMTLRDLIAITTGSRPE